MPVYAEDNHGEFPVTEHLSYRGLNLPSFPELTNDDVKFIAGTILDFLKDK
jgi:perosamine synthetase